MKLCSLAKNHLQQSQQHEAVHLLNEFCVAAINARHQAEKRKLQLAMAPDNVPPARTSTPGEHTTSACS